MADIPKEAIFNIAQGLGASLSGPISLVSARSIAALKQSRNAFKSFVDSSMPSVYIVDLESDIVAPIISSYNLNISTSTVKQAILNNLNSDFVSVEHLQADINKALATLNSEVASNVNNPEEYKQAFVHLGSNITNIFKTSVVIVNDPENMGQTGKLVLIGKSNALIQQELTKATNAVIKQLTNSNSIVSLPDAGYTSLDLNDGTYGINSPQVQEFSFRMEATSNPLIDSSGLQDAYVKTVPIYIENTIKFNENFTPTAKNLLNIGFSFTIPKTLVDDKVGQAALDSMIKNTIMPGIVTAMKSKIDWLASNVTSISGSPTIPAYIKLLASEILRGKKRPESVYSDTKYTKTKIDVQIPIVEDIRLDLNRKLKRSKVESKLPVNTVNLVELQRILDMHIKDVVASNMGTGYRSDILNYRTGRFSHSVHIDHLTMSREGMISVFYDYMRYPYQTFEPGFKQGWPPSRNPKTLISKSIKEIAGEIVHNRLRAVLI